ncbi:MAG: hypothetical protein AB8F78_11755 [Saprospiraceae bacterium]
MKPIEPNHDQDPLKAFIDAQRDAFDNEEPRASVWEALERAMPAKEVQLTPKPASVAPKEGGSVIRQLYPYWRKAAVACMLLTIGVMGGMLMSGDGSPAMADQPSTENRAVELEQYYKREIDRRLAMVASYKPEPELRRELSDMTQSDFRAQQPFDELAAGNERVVLEAIAQEYQAKLDALERVLDRLREAERDQPKLNQPGPRGREEL